MSKQAALSLNSGDVERILELLGTALDPSQNLSIPDRKRFLAEGVCKLIDADVFMWNTAVFDPLCKERIGATCVIDGGWSSSDQKFAVLQLLHDPEFSKQTTMGLLQRARRGHCFVGRREDYIDDSTWDAIGRFWRETGLNHAILCIYPLPTPSFSGVGFHRRMEKPAFSVRDRSIVELIFDQVGWLHRHGMNEPAGEIVVGLSPRERQVLLFLLDGRNKKQIASLFKISEHTVGDYMKSIFKHFDVHSQSELQAFFMHGSQSVA